MDALVDCRLPVGLLGRIIDYASPLAELAAWRRVCRLLHEGVAPRWAWITWRMPVHYPDNMFLRDTYYGHYHGIHRMLARALRRQYARLPVALAALCGGDVGIWAVSCVSTAAAFVEGVTRNQTLAFQVTVRYPIASIMFIERDRRNTIMNVLFDNLLLVLTLITRGFLAGLSWQQIRKGELYGYLIPQGLRN